MGSLTRAAQAVQSTLTELAEDAGQQVGIIQRRRKLSASTLAQTVILTLLEKPLATLKHFAEMAQTLGVDISQNGLKQRFTQKLVDFLKTLLVNGVVKLVVQTQPVPAPLLNRFQGVYVGDSTTLALPDELAAEFPGCGGTQGVGLAALKIQVRLNLTTSAIDYFQFEAGKDCDVKSGLQDAPLPKGALAIYDLGYFDIGKLAERSAQGVFWISRMQCGTTVFADTGEEAWDLLAALRRSSQTVLDVPVRIGAKDRLACRLIAIRCPQEVANRRRQALKEDSQRKGRQPSQRRLAWCDWVILVTNVPVESLSVKDAVVLYRSRWQIELLFKLWKSQGQIAHRSPSVPLARQMALLYGRLLAVFLKHWLILAGTGASLRRSVVKAAQIVEGFVKALAIALKHPPSLEAVLEAMILPLTKATVDTRTTHPSWFQLILDPELLSWEL